MDPLLRQKLNRISRQLDERKRKAFEKEISDIASKYLAEVRTVPKSVLKRFETVTQRYNDYIDAEVEKRENLLPGLTKEERYIALREKGIVRRKETRTADQIIKEIKSKDPKLPTEKLQRLTQMMLKNMKHENSQIKFIRAKEALVRGLGMNTMEGEGAVIKKRIMAMTQPEWEIFNIAHADLIGSIWNHYHTETSADFEATLDFVNARADAERMLSNVLAQHQKHKTNIRKIANARRPKPSKAAKIAKSVASTILRI